MGMEYQAKNMLNVNNIWAKHIFKILYFEMKSMKTRQEELIYHKGMIHFPKSVFQRFPPSGCML